MIYSKRTWQALLDQERLLSELAQKNEGDKEILRSWHRVVSIIFKACAEESRTGRLKLSPPAELFAVFGRLTERLADGVIEGPIEDVRQSRGRPKKSPTEIRHIGWATLYIREARAGNIDDKRFLQTVAEAYGVDHKTVQYWAELPLPDSVDPEAEPTLIKKNIVAAGNIYQSAGPSQKAVLKRAAKQAS